MGHSAGLRSGTRYAFSRKFRQKGMIRLSTYLRQYRYVAAVAANIVYSLVDMLRPSLFWAVDRDSVSTFL